MIVDDEALPRRTIRRLLKGDADIEVVGECADGREAVAAIERLRPDLVFLDVQMPELDGFEVLRSLRSHVPAVVFVTAFDEYAVRAFDVHAIDYLLKPVERDRFRDTLQHVRRQLGQLDEVRERLLAMVAGGPGPGRWLQRLAVRDAHKFSVVPVDEIDWIEAAGNYACVHAARRTHLCRTTIKALAERLDPERFSRVHRGTIVNLERVREVHPGLHGEAVLVLADGTRLAATRTFNQSVQRLVRDGR
jgi:two-component system LytT family response regulator